MHYRTLSIEQRAQLEAAMRSRISELRRDIARQLRQDGRPESISLANHLEETDDEAVADLESALEIAALERESAELRSLEAAFERLQTNAYGVCTDCGADIPFARLAVAPTATRCVHCQARTEREHGLAGAHSL